MVLKTKILNYILLIMFYRNCKPLKLLNTNCYVYILFNRLLEHTLHPKKPYFGVQK